MKTIYALLTTALITNACFAKTYNIVSGKWTDKKMWNNQYPGTTIKADDVVVISGQVTTTSGLLIEGTLKIEKGGVILGMHDLVIAKTGKLVNNGNTVMKRIINEGTIDNTMLVETMEDFDNKGKIENNNNIVAGNNFDNYGGSANGTGGAYFVNNTVLTSPASSFGKAVNVFSASEIEAPKSTSSLMLDATYQGKGVVTLNVTNNGTETVQNVLIEKSSDGSNYTTLTTVNDINSNKKVAYSYTDDKVGTNLTYYRVKALTGSGQQVTLPVATVKTPVVKDAFTMAAN